MTVLDGCSVVEVGEYVAVPYAGKLFSDLGADVVKLEPHDGDAARRVGPFPDDEPGIDDSGFFGYLNTGKRSVTLPDDPALARGVIYDLVAELDADVVLDGGLASHGVDPAALSDAHDGLSVVSVTGFGATGPFREYDAPDVVAWAESGHMNKMGYPDSPPVRSRIKTTDYWAGQVAVMSALSALLSRELQGTDGRYVDVSKREAALSALEHFIAGYSWSGAATERSGTGYPAQDGEDAIPTVFEAADGYVSVYVITPGMWETFCEDALGRPELADDERYATQDARMKNISEIVDLVEDYTADRDKWELFYEFQEIGIPSAVTSTPADVAGLEHLEARDFWREVPLPSGEPATMPGFPYRVDGEPVDMDRAPRLGEHDAEVYRSLGYDPGTLASTRGSASAGERPADDEAERSVGGEGPRPLDGIRIVDFTWVYAGPFASKLLAALGADVVKVESRRKPDTTRGLLGYGFDATDESSVSAYYNEHNQGKRGVRLDLTSDRGRGIALDLIAEADVVMENYSPAFMRYVDLEYEQARAVNPEVVYLSMPGWAKSGPAEEYRSYGLNLQSMAGLDYISGHPDDPPTAAGFSWPDPTGGYAGAVAVLMGLTRRELTGGGTYVELPQFEASVSLLHKPLMEYLLAGRSAERVGNRDEDRRYVQGVYPCAGEDRWAVVAVRTDDQWDRLCSVVGRPGLADDERFASQYARFEHHDEVDEVIRAWTETRSREEVRTRLQGHGVPAGVVADERDPVEYDPQLRVRDYFTTHDHPDVGEQTFQGVPLRMEGTEIEFPSRAPLFGEHTEEVLREWLDMDDGEIADAEGAGALH